MRSKRWQHAAQLAREQLFEHDPLASEGLVSRPTETAMRYRWVNGRWQVDSVTLKVSEMPFAEGSMRLCYLAKKMSSHVTLRQIRCGSKHADWAYQRNCVLKTYKDAPRTDVRSMLESDVQTQAESKMLATRYNERLRGLLEKGRFDRRSPKPMKYKCVDMLEACLVVFTERPGEPCFLMEAHIAGDFEKHNDNFGFVDKREAAENTRATPQAFSHFTFCETKGDKIVVDVQGVGDLFTDPQIHTRNGGGFGVGNGGDRGIALFFATHRCNRICRCMNLAPFSAHYDDKVTPHPLFVLGSTLDEYDLDRELGSATDARAVGDLLPAPVASAFNSVLNAPPPGDDSVLLRHVHKTLGFMLLFRDQAIAEVASPAGALYHIAVATLAREPAALSFTRTALEAFKQRRQRFITRRRNAKNAHRAKQAAALAIIAVAVHNISSLFFTFA